MNIVKSTEEYESWLSGYTTINRADLDKKHDDMSNAAFTFLRATFYRWARAWTKRCKELSDAPKVLAVGDLHVENFGTWRDAEGRLIWGINDFDEACPMSYAIDLVRLAVSASLAIKASHIGLSLPDACKSIIEGYHESLNSGGKPFVLEEEHPWLRAAATGSLRDPGEYWRKLKKLPAATDVPANAVETLTQVLPASDIPFRIVRRIAGEGSLGRQRFVALAEHNGGLIAREIKSLVPSAAVWANNPLSSNEIFYNAIVEASVRCRDPFLAIRGKWVARRLAPDCSKIELAQLAPIKEELRLMRAMGWETANIHLGSPKAVPDVARHLAGQPANWLIDAVKIMEDAVIKDWKEWREANPAREK